MSRSPRLAIPGLLHHVTHRGNNREATFLSDAHRLRYLELLKRYATHFDVQVFGFCLMPNHVHLILRPNAETTLSVLLRRTHAEYAQYFNRATNRSGHLWQDRFYSSSLECTHVYNALR
jgi:putative transposase